MCKIKGVYYIFFTSKKKVVYFNFHLFYFSFFQTNFLDQIKLLTITLLSLIANHWNQISEPIKTRIENQIETKLN